MNVKNFDATHIKTLRQTMTKSGYTLSEDTTHIETQPTQIRFGFSLAEVLITLGIIGVVAAMTIPNLMAKYQKKRKEPNFIFKFEDGEPTKEECVADMAKVFFLLWEAQKRGLKNA